MRIGAYQVWLSATEAKANGFTHHARFLGIVPGFIANHESGCPHWQSRSDLLNPFEDFIAFWHALIADVRGVEPHFSFLITKEIDDAAGV